MEKWASHAILLSLSGHQETVCEMSAPPLTVRVWGMTQETPHIREKERQSPDVQRSGEGSVGATSHRFRWIVCVSRRPGEDVIFSCKIERLRDETANQRLQRCVRAWLSVRYLQICKAATLKQKNKRGCNIFSKGCGVSKRRQVCDSWFFEVWAKVSWIWTLLQFVLDQRVNCRFSLAKHPSFVCHS